MSVLPSWEFVSVHLIPVLQLRSIPKEKAISADQKNLSALLERRIPSRRRSSSPSPMEEAAALEPTSSELPSPTTTTVSQEEEEQGMNHSDETAPHIPPNSEAPAEDSNPDDSDSDSDSEDEAQQSYQLQSLEASLAAEPSNYDLHAQYIKVLRKAGDIEKLRRAREAMSELFPLTPKMWQEWARDEASLSSGPRALSITSNLYERGVFDYLSVSLWLDYLSFVQENDPSVQECSPAGISKARDLFERALTATGLHVAEGGKIWEAYRDFEEAIFLSIDESDTEAKEKQAQRIRSILHRQLSIPLVDLKQTLLAYKAWEMEQHKVNGVHIDDFDGVPPHVTSAYQKALEMYNDREYYEEHISNQDISDSERLQQYMNYIKFEQSSGMPSRIQVLYERAVSEFPISSDLWLDYTRYLDKTLKVGDIVNNVYTRATKNCPWVGELWVRNLLSLERGHASEKDIAAVFEKAMCSFMSVNEYIDLFLTRADSLRRRISFPGEREDSLDYRLIRETFKQASDYLSPHINTEGFNTKGFYRLHAYWARLEIQLGKDLNAARGIWESFLKICGSMLDAWKGYIAMEIELGHIKEARSIYKRCYSRKLSGTGSEDICHLWLCFEREFGTLEDLDHAFQKVTPRLEELQKFRLQQESKSGEMENTLKRNAREKRKPGSEITDEQSPAKRQKTTPRNPKKEHRKDEGRAESSNKAMKVEDMNSKDDKLDGATEKQITLKMKAYSDQCTAFISNLHLKATEQNIRNFFSDIGEITAVRILHDKFTGKSRGLAYVDFLDDAHLAAAVAKNRQMLLGKKISIARSDPKKAKKESTGQGNMKERSHVTHQSGNTGASASYDTSKRAAPVPPKNRVETVQLKGKNTFAVPRNVKPLGWSANRPEVEEGDEKPKSNDEFRKMFIKD